MALAAGQTILHYRLFAPLGQGGMGVVWRAHDTTLGRDVALKFLPAELAGDSERMARLEREARLLASLNHPRIAAIHGFHQSGGVRFLALELVEGETLAQRIARGPIPVEEALALAFQVSEALEHAHEKGVVHRDLKPSNIKLDAHGIAKVLDFGLAKALEDDPAAARSGAELSHSPTLTGGMTAAHVLLGTAAYMSPEQARGKPVDRRADIWAFGVVLMEMLTGRRLFEGETISDTLAAVLRSDPDFSALPKDTPPRVTRLLRRCLERDPRRRLRDIGEARIALDEAIQGVPEERVAGATPAPAPARGLPWLPGVIGLALGALAMFAVTRLVAPPRAEAPLRKFIVEADTTVGALIAPTISPDGTLIASIVRGRIAIRDLTRLEARSFPVETSAAALFWSPDSRHLGYFAGSRVMRVSITDGERRVVNDTRAEFSGGMGGNWTPRGTIVYSPADSQGILEVSERGGDPRVVMPTDPKQEGDVHHPTELPGGRGIVFVSHTLKSGISRLCLWSKGRRKVLLDLPDQTIALPRYSPSGHILFHRSPTTPGIWALPFSLQRLETTGEAFLVAADALAPSVSLDGTLCYLPGRSSVSTQLIWMTRDGSVTPIGEPTERASYSLAADPTGPRVVRSEAAASGSDLWILDHVRGTRTRFSFDPGEEDFPEWSPDGRTIVYTSRTVSCASADCWAVVLRSSDGRGRADTLVMEGVAPTFTPNGRDILYLRFRGGGTFWDLTRIPRDRSGPPVTLVSGNPRAAGGRVSPDGSLLAYFANESGRFEVYLTRYPSLEGRWQVSTSGGQWPIWSATGDRLYFCRGDDILEVDVARGATPTLGNPRLLVTRPHAGPFQFGLDMMFAVSADGRRILTARGPESTHHTPRLAIVQNWAAEFREKK